MLFAFLTLDLAIGVTRTCLRSVFTLSVEACKPINDAITLAANREHCGMDHTIVGV